MKSRDQLFATVRALLSTALRLMPLLAAPVMLFAIACTSSEPSANTAAAQSLPDCEWCGADEAPEELAWQTTIPPEDEPGETLVISGTVLQPDGETPAADIILYVYHTNAHGIYPKRGDETGNGQRHGYLRAWLRTAADGRYRFTTIRPAAYPSRSGAAHIHMTVKEPDRAEYWIDSIKFEGDPLLSPEERVEQTGRGGRGIIRLTRDGDGVWRGRRDIILEPRQ